MVKYLTGILLFVVSYLPASAYSQLPVEAYAKLPENSLMSISPSGKQVAFRHIKDDKDVILIIDVVIRQPVARVDVGEVNPSRVYFIDEDKLIIVATENLKFPGLAGGFDRPRAYAYNLETKKLHSLLDPGLGIFRMQFDMAHLVGISSDKKYAFMGALESGSTYSLYKVNLTKQRKPRVHQRGSSDTRDFFVNSQGEVIARVRFSVEKKQQIVEARKADKWLEIYRVAVEDPANAVQAIYGMTPDEKSLILHTKDKQSGRSTYSKIALADGKISDPIFDQTSRDVNNLVVDINRKVHGIEYSGFTPSYDFFNRKIDGILNGLSDAMPDNQFTVVDHTPDWSKVVLLMAGGTSSGHYMQYFDGALSLLAPQRPGIPSKMVKKIEEYQFKARDGLEIPTLLTLPNVAQVKNLPAIVIARSEPEANDSKSFNYLSQYFANLGYLVVQPQFRGSTGFSESLQTAGLGEWGRKMQDDVSDAVLSLVKSGKINPDRVCIIGTGFGGYSAMAGAVFSPDLYQCVVSINGVSDVEKMMSASEQNFGVSNWVKSYWDDVRSKRQFNEDHLKKISPINHVEKVEAPILLVHGESDKVVPISQSKAMADKLTKADKQVTLVELEAGSHDLSKAENRLKALKTIGEFVKTHLK